VKTDIVDISAMKVRMIALDFNVMRVAISIPAFVAVKGPMENKAVPLVVNGSRTQRKRINPFTIRNREKTFLMGSLARNTKSRAIKRAGIRARKRSETATTIENIPATMDLTLGSRRWITESPAMNPSSST
jgi:histone acetyltransferase (RNA polymerase elongator complex component)